MGSYMELVFGEVIRKEVAGCELFVFHANVSRLIICTI